MIAAKHERIRVVMIGALATSLLAGCSPQLPFTESFRTAIPAALLASDLGITDATADNGISGFAVDLEVTVEFDRNTISSEELGELLSVIVESNNLSNPDDLSILALDGSTAEKHDYVELGAVGAELGFAQDPDNPELFVANWDDVMEFVNE